MRYIKRDLKVETDSHVEIGVSRLRLDGVAAVILAEVLGGRLR